MDQFSKLSSCTVILMVPQGVTGLSMIHVDETDPTT